MPLFAIQFDVHRDVVKGSNELSRRSTVYSGRVVLRLFGRRLPVTPNYLLYEEVNEWMVGPPRADVLEPAPIRALEFVPFRPSTTNAAKTTIDLQGNVFTA